MSTIVSPQVRRPALSLPLALVLILLIWIAYVAVYTWHPSDALAAVLESLPGILAVAVLLAAGFSLSDCYLKVAPLSKKGLTYIGAAFLFMPIMWITGKWVGWRPLHALAYAPASGITQELFFRAALLPLLLAVFKSRPTLGILVQALLFSAWHGPLSYLTAPLAGFLSVLVVTFICGILWARQVQHDGTVFWMMVYHSLLLIVNTFFIW